MLLRGAARLTSVHLTTLQVVRWTFCTRLAIFGVFEWYEKTKKAVWCSMPRSRQATHALAPRPPSVSHDPARGVPVPARPRVVQRDDHHVADLHRDLLLAAGAAVDLAGLGRVHTAHLHALGAGGKPDQVLQPA